MQVHLSIQDNLTPDLRRKVAALSNRRPCLLAMGEAVVSLAKRAFTQPGLRPAEWKERDKRRTWSHPILRQSGDLWQGIHVVQADKESVTVGSPKVYAAVHQFGSNKTAGRGSGIPARPFMPIIGKPDSATLTPRADSAILSAIRRFLASI